MKTKIKFLFLIAIAICLFSCSKTTTTSTNTTTVPVLTTTALSAITATTASSGGNITSDGGGAVTARGVCWNTSSNPTISNSKTTDGTGTGNFSSSLTGLISNTTYYVRAYATNSAGTSYGNQVSFATSFICGVSTIKDIEGNVYNTVSIAGQCWMKENLKTSKYKDGTAIPNAPDTLTWNNTSSGAYCYYNNDISNDAVYGKLYNSYAVNTGKLAPTGWHIPTNAEFGILRDSLGGISVAGGKMKSTSSLWIAPNTGADNSSGFSGLPAGSRQDAGAFYNLGYFAYFWDSNPFLHILSYNFSDLSEVGSGSNQFGFSVRCIKN